MFAFDSKTWETCIGPPVMLTRVFRQKDQGTFCETCGSIPLTYLIHSFRGHAESNALRLHGVTDCYEISATVPASTVPRWCRPDRVVGVFHTPYIITTSRSSDRSRYPKRDDVDRSNIQRLQQINETPQIYVAMDKRGRDTEGQLISAEKMMTLLKRLVAVPELVLKVRVNPMPFEQHVAHNAAGRCSGHAD